MRTDIDGNSARYELQWRAANGHIWTHERDAGSVAALKPHAQSIVDDYRIIDHERGMVRGLDVMPTTCVLADGGWVAVDLARCHGCGMAIPWDEANFDSGDPWCDGCYVGPGIE